MEYRRLGNTDIRVSVIGLGTMTWGEQNGEDDAVRQLDAAVDSGVNLLDTAEMYPFPAKRETQGLTEAYIGRWMKARRNRDRVVVATKVTGRADRLTHIRGGPRLDRRNILAAIDGSLGRLRTDYVDLYQLHWPDRNTNYFGRLGYRPADEPGFIPLEEILGALADLVGAGKVRAVGVSNETPWGLMTFLKLSERDGLPRMAGIQNPYNLLNRVFEIGLAEIAARERCGLLAYSPLAFGVLSGKYLDGRPPGARLTLYPEYTRYVGPKADRAVRAYVDLARRHGLDPAQMALAYVNSRPFVTSTLIGATTMAQLKTNLASADLDLSREVMAAIEAIHAEDPNPCP